MDEEAWMDALRSADDHQITCLIRAIIRRYRELYPDEEIIFLSLPTADLQERQLVLRHALRDLGMTET